jgi:bile acid:Na+ symporter, BASS family
MTSRTLYRSLLALSGISFAGSLIFYALSKSELIGIAMVSGFILLALGMMGIPSIKKFTYTIWILTAVTAAMFFPGHLITIGNFQLKKLIVPFVQITMFGMGSQMSFDDFKGVIKMPKGVIIGICCHFLVMPLVGLSLARLFRFPPEIAAGVVLIGCVSSAMASNVMSYISRANLALAITIGAFSTILSPFITPFLMKTLAGQYIEINILNMMVDITNMIIIPIVAGFIFNLFYFEKEDRRNKILQLTAFAGVIILTNLILMISQRSGLHGFVYSFTRSFIFFYILPIVMAIILRHFLKGNKPLVESILAFIAMLGIVVNTTIITASGRDNLIQVGGLLILSCLIHNLTGFSLGYTVSWLLGMPEKDRRTIGFEVGMQNGGVATGLALEMGKVATVGLASTIFGPLQNITGSALANWFRNRPAVDEPSLHQAELEMKGADE